MGSHSTGRGQRAPSFVKLGVKVVGKRVSGENVSLLALFLVLVKTLKHN